MMYKYVANRGVVDLDYMEYVQNPSLREFSFKPVAIENFEFEVNQLFDNSHKLGYGLIITNETLGTDKGDMLAIGSIEGDDIICMEIPTKVIYLWMIENGDGEYIKIADSFRDFLGMCCE